MNKFFLLIFISFGLISCSGTKEIEDIVINNDKNNVVLDSIEVDNKLKLVNDLPEKSDVFIEEDNLNSDNDSVEISNISILEDNLNSDNDSVEISNISILEDDNIFDELSDGELLALDCESLYNGSKLNKCIFSRDTLRKKYDNIKKQNSFDNNIISEDNKELSINMCSDNDFVNSLGLIGMDKVTITDCKILIGLKLGCSVITDDELTLNQCIGIENFKKNYEMYNKYGNFFF